MQPLINAHDSPLPASLHLSFHWLLRYLPHLDQGVHSHILPESQNYHLAPPHLLTGNKSPQGQEWLLPSLALMLTPKDGECKPRVGADIVAISSGTTWSISHLGDPLDRWQSKLLTAGGG